MLGFVSEKAEAALMERIQPLIAAAGQVLVLERVARGGGATRWFCCHTALEVEQVLRRCRPGSRVVFLFDDRIRREPLSEAVGTEIWDLAVSIGEVLVGTQRPADPEVDMALLDQRELSEYIAALRPGEPVFFGSFPATEDGPAAITFTPPDPDGVVRPQPV